MPFTNPIIGGAAALIRAAIRTPNFVSLVSGWSINKDGTAEFNSLLSRGDFIAGSNLGPPNPPLEEAVLSSGALNPITGTAALVLLDQDATGRQTQLIAYADPNTTGDVVLAAQLIGATFAEMRFTAVFVGTDPPHLALTVPIKFDPTGSGGTQRWAPAGRLTEAFSTAATSNTTTEAKDGGTGDLTFTAVQGRKYRLYYGAIAVAGTANATAELHIRANNSASSPGTGATLMAGDRAQIINTGGAGSHGMKAIGDFNCTGSTNIAAGTIAAGTWTFAGFYASTVGGINVQVSNIGGVPRSLWVDDVGGS